MTSSLHRIRPGSRDWLRFLARGAGLWLACAAAPAFAQPYTFTTFAGGGGLYGAQDGTGRAARFSNPYSVATDGAGNLYVADTYNYTIRKITPAGVVTTVAGLAGSVGSADGTGSAARFNYPGGVATDSGGNLYVADTYNHTIRKITPAGVVTTIAGLAGSYGSADGTGSAARFREPYGVATDSGGNLYVADSQNHTIRKITPAGVVTTVAGLAGLGGSADGTGSAARFNYPGGVATDSAENLYVADNGNYTIRKITPAGVVTTVAGLAGLGGSADGTGSAALFYRPWGVATDSGGNLYVADTGNHTIRKITPAGAVTTIAGLAGLVGSADGTGSSARFYSPSGVATDSGGNLYVADTWNSTIRKITPAGVVTTLAGVGSQGSADGTGSAARFLNPYGVATDSGGNLYVADTYNYTIRKITPAGVVTTLAGLAGSFGSADGTGSAAQFGHPTGIATDSGGNLYVADAYYSTIRKITPAGVVTTVAGLAGSVGSTDGTGSAARFYNPSGVATDSGGNLYVADSYNCTIRKITPAGVVTTLAGLAGSFGSADGTGSAARFWEPKGVATDSAGNLYVADSINNTIRKITPAGVVTTIAGLAGYQGSADGTGSAARFNSPSGVATDSAGNLYVADTDNHTIRKITPAGVVTTLAGLAGSYGSADGTGSSARFYKPYGVATDSGGNLYVADTNNNTIRKGAPALADVATIDSANNVTGAVRQLDTAPQTAVSWSWLLFRQPATSSAALSSATIRNPTFTPDAPDLYLFRLTATDAAGRSSITTVQLDAGCPKILAAPASRSACAGAPTAFTVSASGNPAPAYQWSRNGTPIGGATSATYAIAAVAAADAGDYACALANGCGNAVTPVATLTVGNFPPGAVGNSQTVGKSGANLLLRWTDIANAASYAIFQDAAPGGAFATQAGTASSGATGLTLAPPAGNAVFFKIAGVNGCGTGPK